jgi:hypothetical protein
MTQLNGAGWMADKMMAAATSGSVQTRETAHTCVLQIFLFFFFFFLQETNNKLKKNIYLRGLLDRLA